MEIRHWNLCLSDKVHCKHWILALSHEMPEFPCIDDVSQCFSIVPSHNPCLASYKNPRLLKASRRKPLDETPEREKVCSQGVATGAGERDVSLRLFAICRRNHANNTI